MSDLEAFNLVQTNLEPLGFEVYSFRIGDYNKRVDTRFRLNYENDTLAILVINTPKMFDTTFMKFLESHRNNLDCLKDPIDECMSFNFNCVKEKLVASNFGDVEMIQDFELVPSTRRAKILLQTCAHISGAAYFYKSDEKSQMGVCLHSRFGGWFAMRCVFIFKNVTIKDLPIKEPIDVLKSDETLIQELKRRFNINWKDGSYRDIIQVEDRYSAKQIDYFLTDPSNRKDLIKSWYE